MEVAVEKVHGLLVDMGGGRVLDPHELGVGWVGGSQPRHHLLVQQFQVYGCVDCDLVREDVGWHDFPVAGDEAKDENLGGFLGLHHEGDALSGRRDPSVILGVVGIVHGENGLIRKKLDDAWVDLALVTELLPSLQSGGLHLLGEQVATSPDVGLEFQVLLHGPAHRPAAHGPPVCVDPHGDHEVGQDGLLQAGQEGGGLFFGLVDTARLMGDALASL